VALADYKAVEGHATALRGISRADEFLNFRRDEEYQFQARVFQRSATRRAEAARGKNADAVLLSYLDLSASCVRCHQTFRAGKID